VAVVSVSAVEHSYLVHGENDFEGIDGRSGALEDLFSLALDESSNETVHILVSLVVLLLVA